MKVSAFLRKSATNKNSTAMATVYLRVREGSKDYRLATELEINPNHWSSEKQGYKDRIALVAEEEKQKFNRSVSDLKAFIINSYTDDIDIEWVKMKIEEFHHPERFKIIEAIAEGNAPMSVHDLFLEFLEKHKLSEVRKKNFRVIGRAMQRYELYVRVEFPTLPA